MLTAIGAAEAVPAFHAALQEPNQGELLVMAAEFLGNHASGQTEVDVIPSLAQTVGRWRHPARIAAARALGQLEDLRAVPALVQSLEFYEDDFAPAVIDSLGALGSPDAVEKLAEFVQGPNDYLAQKAAQALGRIGHPSAVPGAGRGHDARQGRPAGQEE